MRIWSHWMRIRSKKSPKSIRTKVIPQKPRENIFDSSHKVGTPMNLVDLRVK